MKYKDALSYECKCGRELVVPIESLQEKSSIAPNMQQMKNLQYRLTQEIIYHQNRNCPVMFIEREKARLKKTRQYHSAKG